MCREKFYAPVYLFSLCFHWISITRIFIYLQKVQIVEFDRENFRIKARGFGETFEIGKHPQGADIKAITYSNMQIHENSDKSEVFVIVDI